MDLSSRRRSNIGDGQSHPPANSPESEVWTLQNRRPSGELSQVTHEEILDTLRTTPDRVEASARSLSPEHLARRPKEGEWSMGEILHHLLIGERDVILPRLRRMLREDSPVFPSSAPSRTGFAASPAPSDFAEDLSAFRRVRSQTLAFLDGLGGGDWQRTGTTPTRGTLTIEAYARYLAEHDLEHLAQLRETRTV